MGAGGGRDGLGLRACLVRLWIGNGGRGGVFGERGTFGVLGLLFGCLSLVLGVGHFDEYGLSGFFCAGGVCGGVAGFRDEVCVSR